jgi:hypothetical protein
MPAPALATSARKERNEPTRAHAAGGMVYGPRMQSQPQAPRSYPSGRPSGDDGPISRSAVEWASAPEAASRASFVALVRGWMRVLTPGGWASVHETPHPVVVRVVRWAPIIAPAVFGSLLLTLALALVAHHAQPTYSPLPAFAVVPALFAVYLIGGALLGIALYFAPNGVVWSLAFFGAPLLLLVIMLGLAFGAPGAILAFTLLVALLLVYSCMRRSLTRAGTVEVTLLLGEWYRALPPGYNILLPGERVIVALRTTPRAFTTAIQRVALAPDRIAQARATVAYVVNAREAWRTAGVRATWEDELRQRISASVRESLGEWRNAPGDDVAAHGSIAQRALDDTRDWARSVGVRILSVRAHDIVIGPPGQPQPTQAPQQQPMRASARPTPRMPRMADMERMERMERAPVAASASALAPAERPSSEALEDLYDAVRNRQITDTQVIREIADHFAALARQPRAADGALPFDPISAARLLENYADSLDAMRSAQRAAQRPAQRARRR